jgi:pimeloyl-ACP methyl ester carboxylesterase
VAARYPELVRGLILVGGFATLPPEATERFRGRARTAETKGMGPLADLVPAAAMGAHIHATNPALVGLFRQALLTNDPPAYAACCRAIAEGDVTPLLGEVRCPTLILLGAQEQVAPLAAAQGLKAGIPHAEVCVIPNAGHLPFMEQPGAFNAAVYEFVVGLSR